MTSCQEMLERLERRKREIEKERDRESDKERDRESDKERQSEIQMDRQVDRQKIRQPTRQSHSQRPINSLRECKDNSDEKDRISMASTTEKERLREKGDEGEMRESEKEKGESQ